MKTVERKKGEIVTLLLIGGMIILGSATVLSSYFVSKNKNTTGTKAAGVTCGQISTYKGCKNGPWMGFSSGMCAQNTQLGWFRCGDDDTWYGPCDSQALCEATAIPGHSTYINPAVSPTSSLQNIAACGQTKAPPGRDPFPNNCQTAIPVNTCIQDVIESHKEFGTYGKWLLCKSDGFWYGGCDSPESLGCGSPKNESASPAASPKPVKTSTSGNSSTPAKDASGNDCGKIGKLACPDSNNQKTDCSHEDGAIVDDTGHCVAINPNDTISDDKANCGTSGNSPCTSENKSPCGSKLVISGRGDYSSGICVSCGGNWQPVCEKTQTEDFSNACDKGFIVNANTGICITANQPINTTAPKKSVKIYMKTTQPIQNPYNLRLYIGETLDKISLRANSPDIQTVAITVPPSFYYYSTDLEIGKTYFFKFYITANDVEKASIGPINWTIAEDTNEIDLGLIDNTKFSTPLGSIDPVNGSCPSGTRGEVTNGKLNCLQRCDQGPGVCATGPLTLGKVVPGYYCDGTGILGFLPEYCVDAAEMAAYISDTNPIGLILHCKGTDFDSKRECLVDAVKAHYRRCTFDAFTTTMKCWDKDKRYTD